MAQRFALAAMLGPWLLPMHGRPAPAAPLAADVIVAIPPPVAQPKTSALPGTAHLCSSHAVCSRSDGATLGMSGMSARVVAGVSRAVAAQNHPALETPYGDAIMLCCMVLYGGNEHEARCVGDVGGAADGGSGICRAA